MSVTSRILEHEKNRVKGMQDGQLDTRYGKMNNREKIEAFHQALKDENRNERLRKRIESDYPEMALGDAKVEHENEWVLFRENENHGFNHEYITFTQTKCSAGLLPCLLVSEPSPMRVHADTVQHSTESARQLWDQLIKDGWRLEIK